MFEIIVAMTKNRGIGLDNHLPWCCAEELKIFRDKTLGHILVMGKNTISTLPRLNNRSIYCLRKNKNEPLNQTKNNVKIIDLTDLQPEQNKIIFIAGGGEIYNFFLNNQKLCSQISKFHISIMKNDYPCDTFISLDIKNLCVIEHKEYDEFNHYVMIPKKCEEYQYLDLLKNVLYNGSTKIGRNGETKSIFGHTLNFDLRYGFPLITTKKMFMRGIFEELMFFIRGQTDSKILEKKQINIWKGNTSREFLDRNGFADRKEGVIGPMYGYQWRKYNAPYSDQCDGKDTGRDQLEKVINDIKNDPSSRRILMTSYNPEQASLGVLYPCHSIILQFNVENEFLDMFCYNRSSDLFHGLPFNITSSSMLLYFIAKICKLTPRKFMLSIGDAHIYKEHNDPVTIQIERLPFQFPSIEIKKELNTILDLEQLEYDDILIQHYKSYENLKTKMII